MADGFEEANTGGNGEVKAVYMTLHGNGNPLIAEFGGEVADPLTLGAHDDGERTGQVGFVEGVIGLVGGGDALNIELFQGANKLVEVSDLHIGNAVGASAGDPADGFGQSDSAFAWGDDGGDAGGIGGSQAGPEVMRVFYTIEKEEEGGIRGILQLLEEFFR